MNTWLPEYTAHAEFVPAAFCVIESCENAHGSVDNSELFFRYLLTRVLPCGADSIQINLIICTHFTAHPVSRAEMESCCTSGSQQYRSIRKSNSPTSSMCAVVISTRPMSTERWASWQRMLCQCIFWNRPVHSTECKH